jgi:hypothetical protein
LFHRINPDTNVWKVKESRNLHLLFDCNILNVERRRFKTLAKSKKLGGEKDDLCPICLQKSKNIP